MRKAGVSDAMLCAAVADMLHGFIDADLGGHLIKQRVALPGRGKRGGVRTIVATNFRNRWFFLYGFSKKDRANIDQPELRALQQEALELLALSDQRLDTAIGSGEIVEICDESETR
jgi:hypothetical protein